MSFLYEIISIFIGRWILGNIGYGIKRCFYFLIGSDYTRKKSKPKSDFGPMLDMEEFSNRVIGLLTLCVVIMIAKILF
jgi:hypothetical protein